MSKTNVRFGALCGIMTGVCWGISGVMSEFLFTKGYMTPGVFVSIRLILSGMIMMVYSLIKNRSELMLLLKNKKDAAIAVLTGIAGTMLFQLMYYETVDLSNAGTATILQYLCPVMVMAAVCIKTGKAPVMHQVVSIALALAGIFLISTHGNIHTLLITPQALLSGVGCAFFMMISTVLPENLYKKYSTQTITAVALLAGGIVANAVIRPWNRKIIFDGCSFSALGAAVVFGGIVAYVLYAFAIKNIGPDKASLFACSEILTATLASCIWFNNRFTIIDGIGFAMIVVTIFILTIKKREK